ncbi:LysM peptidoglycan-binding domain-containing protein [Dyella sp. BiH032]|uniref:LysM peptidoglycan-binding domain-containing protein n=1 Tax=Dyella sp. BiH032 TaxID=3075430 RepID=UPI002892C0D1|nr:LysM peptidoglycan-binding domain-containing protein [Dyella sp. BiH032]WNL45924.1 LysM peptidoglycan-binding domain-containing protein [Dyella sp. BiH032]
MAIPRDLGVSTYTPPPPPPPPPEKPKPYRVEHGDTLESIAQKFNTTVDALHQANPSLSGSRIMAGDVLTIPAVKTQALAGTPAKADAPALTPQQQVDKALNDYRQAAANRQPGDRGAADDLAGLQDKLDQAVNAEVQARLKEPVNDGLTPQQRKQLGEQPPSLADREKAARADVLKRYNGDAAIQHAVDKQEAGSLLASNANAGYTSPKDKLLALDTALKNASSDQVRSLAEADPAFAKTVQDAANWAAQPYKEEQLTNSNQVEPKAKQAEESAGRYAELMAGLSSPAARAAIASEGRTQMEQLTHFAFFYNNEQRHSGNILDSLSTVVGTLRQSDPNAAQSLANDLAGQLPDPRIVASGMTTESMLTSMAQQSGDPTLAFAFVDKVRNGGYERITGPWCEQTMAELFKTVENTHYRVDNDVQSYVKLTGELNSLIAKEGKSMTADQLKAAIDNYKAKKGPEWEQQVADAQQRIADDGKLLLSQQAALAQWAAGHPGDQKAVNDTLGKILGSENNAAAMRLAVQNDPTVLKGEQGQALLNQWAQYGKVADQAGRKLTQELGTNYVKGRLDDLREQLAKSDDVATRTKVIQQLDDLGNNKSLAVVLGLDGDKVGSLKQATDVLKNNLNDFDALAKDAKTPEALTQSLQDGLKDADGKLGKIKGFDNGTPVSTLFRAFSVGAAGLSLANATDKLGTGKTGTEELRNEMSALISAAGFSQKTAGLVTSVGWAPKESLWGTVGKRSVDHWVNILSGGIDLWKASDAFGKGDNTEGALYATTGVGSIMWAAGNAAVSGEGMLGAALGGASGLGSWAGPIGIGLVALGTVGLIAYQSKKENDQAVPGREAFLQGLGYTESASKALAAWHSDGDQPAVNMLVRYGELHGMNPQQSMDWFNKLGAEQQKTFAGAMVSALDTVDGDASKFQRTDRNDGNWDDMAKHGDLLAGNVDHGLFGSGPGVLLRGTSIPGNMFPLNVEEKPGSAHQLDVVLKNVLGVDPPAYS